jgi:hypothetical protein
MGVALVLSQLFAKVIASITMPFFMDKADYFMAVWGFTSNCGCIED